MKGKIVLSLFVMGLGFWSCSDGADSTVKTSKVEGADVYELQLERSIVEWKADLMGLYSHTGTLRFKGGTFEIVNQKIVSGEFVVDMNTLSTTDGEEAYKYGERSEFEEHLRADDFLNVDDFEESKLTLMGAGLDEHEMPVTLAKLTLKGITKEVVIRDVAYEATPEGVQVSGFVVINRQDFEINYVGSNADWVIGDEVQLHVIISGKS